MVDFRSAPEDERNAVPNGGGPAVVNGQDPSSIGFGAAKQVAYDGKKDGIDFYSGSDINSISSKVLHL